MNQKHIEKSISRYKMKKRKFVNHNKKLRGTLFRKCMHPLIKIILRFRNKRYGITYEVCGCELHLNKGETVLLCLTHIGKFDFEVFMDACDICCYPVAGDWNLMYGKPDDFFLRLNGVLYVDAEDKKDRKNTYEAMVKMLSQGISMLVYPEGTWNLTQCLPVMKLFSGVVRAAKEAKVPIIPVAIEQDNKHFRVNIGERVYINGDINLENITLRDEMATLQWENWINIPKLERKNISDDYYNCFVQSKLAEYPQYTMEIISREVYQDAFK